MNTILTLVLAGIVAAAVRDSDPQPVPLIFDTHIMGDVDDVGTVAVLHAPADQGEVKGLRFVEDSPQVFGEHGLLVTRWSEPVGGDMAIEVDVSAGGKWTLGMAVDGDSFDGYRIIFAAPNYPNGISVDSIYPIESTLLAQDPRPIATDQDHTLRVEKRGPQFRVWVDRELRIDTALSYPWAPDPMQTFAISEFGTGPHTRSLRVWKGAGN